MSETTIDGLLLRLIDLNGLGIDKPAGLAYAPGSDPVLDEALARTGDIELFLKQGPDEATDLEQTLGRLRNLTSRSFG